MQKKIFEEIVKLLTDQGLILKKGTIVDSTFIEAPSSTKNQKKVRDPEAHSTKKGKGNTAQSTPDGFALNLLAYFPSSCTEIP